MIGRFIVILWMMRIELSASFLFGARYEPGSTSFLLKPRVDPHLSSTNRLAQLQENEGPQPFTTTRFRARVSYDGTVFCGFQLQSPNQRTVQGCLERAISQRFGYNTRVVAAGRTDAGVHARGQAIHFDILQVLWNQNEDSLPRIEHAINCLLPTDIVLWNLQVAPARKEELTKQPALCEKHHAWNVMYKSTGKLYSYRLCLGSARMHPVDRVDRWQPKEAVDIKLLDKLLQSFVGTHNFEAFVASVDRLRMRLRASDPTGQKELNTSRTVYSVDLVHEEHLNPSYYRIDIHLKGALYKQVRNMVGTVLEVATTTSKKPPLLTQQGFLLLLNGVPRKLNPCSPAPPQGLTLEHVFFEDDDIF